MKIVIKEEFSKDYISREAGEKLRNLILSEEGPHELDFKDLKIASISFFDESIAKLAEVGWTSVTIKEKLILKNIYKFDEQLLKQVCAARGLEI